MIRIKIDALYFIVILGLSSVLFSGAASADKLNLSYQEKMEVIKRIERLKDYDGAFFHEGVMDEINISHDDLGVFFNKKFLENEDKTFFLIRARHICKVIREVADDKGYIKIYFYQKAILRKYNEEGLAKCYLKSGDYSVSLENRLSRYTESIFKWGVISVSSTYKFLTDP